MTRYDTTQNNTTKHDTTQHETTRHDTARHDRARHDTTGHGTTQHDTKRHDTTGTKHTVLNACCIGLRMRCGTFYYPGQGKDGKACGIDNIILWTSEKSSLLASVLQGV
jgi:hypothetical protein